MRYHKYKIISVFLAGIAIALFMYRGDAFTSPVQSGNARSYVNSPFLPRFQPMLPSTIVNAPSVPFPVNGTIVYSSSDDPIATLEITTGSRFNNYYFLLRESISSVSVKIFMSGDSTHSFSIPLGTYAMYYTYGDTWYGEPVFFGNEFHVYRSDSIFDFYIDDDTDSISGYTFIIDPIQGNTSSTNVSSSELLD